MSDTPPAHGSIYPYISYSFSETPQETAARECLEETGLKVQKKDLQDFPDNEYTADIQRKDGTLKDTPREFSCVIPLHVKKAVETAYRFLQHGKI